ncbi:Protein of unknown function [Cotesia congregata]|uniref:Uncharacterized protein n=1 Tax=Cotesia congregata TaxID=51543 RepID=A0A8J2HU86_COTCN|nr:Protein of unknown function [Cotesia congregata]
MWQLCLAQRPESCHFPAGGQKTYLQLRSMKSFPNLYMSKNPVFTKYYAPWTRKNWALKKKFDKIRRRRIRTEKRINASEQMDEVTENDLIPTYKIFGVSLIIAIIIEKMFTHSKTEHKQTMSRVEPKIERSKRQKILKKHKRNRNKRSWYP